MVAVINCNHYCQDCDPIILSKIIDFKWQLRFMILSYQQRRIVFGWRELICLIKWSITFAISSPAIQPNGCARPRDPGGASLATCDLKWTRRNSTPGGMALPCGLVIQRVVTKTPFSLLIIWLTCFKPLWVMIFLVFLNVEVSSKSKTRDPSAKDAHLPQASLSLLKMLNVLVTVRRTSWKGVSSWIHITNHLPFLCYCGYIYFNLYTHLLDQATNSFPPEFIFKHMIMYSVKDVSSSSMKTCRHI